MVMGRRRLRCTLLIVFGLSVLCLFLIYKWPLNSLDRQDGRDFAVPATSWWLPWKIIGDRCKDRNFPPPRGNGVLDTGKMYEFLDFHVEPGTRTFWNRTFEDRYLQLKDNPEDGLPLEVIVVPNSHIDPGWLRTYDEYYHGSVMQILDNMVSFLNKTPEFTFIWSEMSYFSMWWKNLKPDVKSTVKALLKRRQLEIVTGGWVMSDEATTHYWSIVDQLVEGHQFLKLEAGILPTYAWSVDIFGHSSTMPNLLNAAGMKGMVVLRVHYAWKSSLASSQALDFAWDTGSDSFIPCHMSPSDLYSIKHACGPDPNVCLQFDFRSIPHEYSESVATAITEENVIPKAELLLGQYRRYASLYPHNVLLVPLGDDFRYNFPVEWEQQYQNYKKLFIQINQSKQNVRVRFGTVSDYFEKVAQRIQSHPGLALPPVTGDFLPYADIYSDGVPSYWTGFYSSRPFAKTLARELEHWLRTAEILYSYVLPVVRGKDRKLTITDYSQLMSARHSLAVFQHHDAITGTSKYYVMEDYIRRLHRAINEAMTVVSHAAQHLLMTPSPKKGAWTSKVSLDSRRTHPETMTAKTPIKLTSKGRKVLIFNSLTFHRREVVRIRVRTLHVKVMDDDGGSVPIQINPVWNATAGMLRNEYELLFLCDIKPMSFRAYTIVDVPEDQWDSFSKAEVSLFIAGDKTNRGNSAFSFKQQPPSDIDVKTQSMRVKFTEKGFPKEIHLKNEAILRQVHTDFYFYHSKPHVSGAYLFNPFPDGPVPLHEMTSTHPITKIVSGPLVTEVTFSQMPLVTLTTRVNHFEDVPQYLDIDSTFDLSRMKPGVELVMRVESQIANNGIFHTDSNGLHMVRRKVVPKLPVQGNYYPVTTASYIEDGDCRLNLLTAQSHGMTSLPDGVLEVMLDRRIEHDDLRGLSEGLLDNKPTSAKFRLLLEPAVRRGSAQSALTPAAHVASRTMLYPLTTLIVDSSEVSLLPSRFTLAKKPWPIGTHLANLKVLPSSTDFYLPGIRSLLITVNYRVLCEDSTELEDDVSALLVNVSSVERTSLTGVGKPIPSSGYESVLAYDVGFSPG